MREAVKTFRAASEGGSLAAKDSRKALSTPAVHGWFVGVALPRGSWGSMFAEARDRVGQKDQEVVRSGSVSVKSVRSCMGW